ncbi:MAG: J domain-containing protein [Proteobacteria bacterium]|nr:J domain-containing protein [Pseudomonadota bacterium]
MKDLYQILGVSRSAGVTEVKKAYRKLAKKLHPDANMGNETIAERFKEVSAAYAIIGDKEQRARYDRGDIDASGAIRNPFAGAGADAKQSEVFEEILRNFGGGVRGFGGGRGRAGGGGPAGFDFSGSAEDIFADLFGFGRARGARGGRPGAGQRRSGSSPLKGQDAVYKLTVPFLDAARGVTRQVTLQTGKTLNVKIPEGVKDGQQIRLAGQGPRGMAGGRPGDALIKITVKPHSFFRLEGNDILLELPITVDEAVLGAKIQVPTVSGAVAMKVPKGSSSGKRLRLKGKGLKSGRKHGDQIVILKIALPEKSDPDLEKAISKWRKNHEYSVRAKFGVK